MSNWHPNLFEAHCQSNEFCDDFTYISLEYGRNLHSKGYPVVFSLAHLSKLSDSHYSKLREVIYRTIRPYDRFKIQKRSGGYRQITVPHTYLFVVQKWININILGASQSHPCANAYIKGKSIVSNAEVHCGARWLVKMDIQRFFESISEKQVYHVFKKMGYTNLLSFELARLCTIVTSNMKKSKSSRWNPSHNNYDFYNYSYQSGHLPQGAPTSPTLSNLVFHSLDKKIDIISKKYGCTYTRYSDDLIFSSYSLDRGLAKELIAEVSEVLSQNGFRRNMKKTHIVPPGARKIVTGLVVDSSSPKIQKELKERIDNHLYYSIKFGPQSHCVRKEFKSVLGFKNHLKGLIDYVSSVDKILGIMFLKKFDQIKWPELL